MSVLPWKDRLWAFPISECVCVQRETPWPTFVPCGFLSQLHEKIQGLSYTPLLRAPVAGSWGYLKAGDINKVVSPSMALGTSHSGPHLEMSLLARPWPCQVQPSSAHFSAQNAVFLLFLSHTSCKRHSGRAPHGQPFLSACSS